VGDQEVRWERGDTVRAGDFVFLYGKCIVYEGDKRCVHDFGRES
jgi:hypothetical protein